MSKFIITFIIAIALIVSACGKKSDTDSSKGSSKMSFIDKSTIEKTIDELVKKYGDSSKIRIEKGTNQAAMLWTEKDGSKKDFTAFCIENFINDPTQLELVFTRLQDKFHSLFGHFNKMQLDLNLPLHLNIGEILPVDQTMAGYNPAAHLTEDLFQNKVAFYILLNFPVYSLTEKDQLSANWNRLDWAYSKITSMFLARPPAELLQKSSEVRTNADTYISEYNIMAGYLTDSTGANYFPQDKKLISHWNLRDELKSQYSAPDGLYKQQMIYQVMQRIIAQDIPQMVINNDKVTWDPFKNVVFENGKQIEAKPEPNTRYQHLLNCFKAEYSLDPYYPVFPTYIQRKFDDEMQMPVEQVEELFIKLISSPTSKKVAELISKRLGRPLQPFDIWYDGFKARSSISEEELNKITLNKYPSEQAFAADMPNILQKLGYSPEKAKFISSKIEVQASRGAGHAWGAGMKEMQSYLRTRLAGVGMDYKGYNIACHEFGHNVEQTINIQDVDHFLLSGVPNTAFTEAWAFVFQKRDLDLLGIKENNPDKEFLLALDNYWSCFEIMGVSLVDINVWRWLYKNPNANAEQLKEAVISISKEIWNKYYADIFGVKDAPILAIYSHMIDYPLYLSAYPVGHLIEFQIEQYVQGKNLGEEMQRMITQGWITPNAWMKGAVGEVISVDPIINATNKALEVIK